MAIVCFCFCRSKNYDGEVVKGSADQNGGTTISDENQDTPPSTDPHIVPDVVTDSASAFDARNDEEVDLGSKTAASNFMNFFSIVGVTLVGKLQRGQQVVYIILNL